MKSTACCAACLLLAIELATGETAPKERVVRWAELIRGPRGKHQIALTFDAGGEASEFPRLLEILRLAEAPAFFFVTVDWARRCPADFARLSASGHAIGNHSRSHRDLTKLSDAEIRDEVGGAGTWLSQRFPRPLAPLFRAPFGERDERVLRVAQECGYRSVYWTFDSLDSVEPRKTAAFLSHRVLSCTDRELDGAILLLHVGYPETVEALPRIIRTLRERRFEFVSLLAWTTASSAP